MNDEQRHFMLVPHGRPQGAFLHVLPLRGLRSLPWRACVAISCLAFCSAAPAVVVLAKAIRPGKWGDLNAEIVTSAAGALWIGVLLAFEPPRSASPLAYARQLHARFLELQSTFDADDRRRPREGKEKEDDRVPSEP